MVKVIREFSITFKTHLNIYFSSLMKEDITETFCVVYSYRGRADDRTVNCFCKT